MRLLPLVLLIFQTMVCHIVLGEGSVSREFFPPSEMSRPGYLVPVQDKRFGGKVTRIVDDPGAVIKGTNVKWSRPARHIYSSVAAWDCSDSLLAIRNAGASKTDGSGAWEWVLLDGASFQPVDFVKRSFVEFRWWNTKPKRMLLITRKGLVDYDPIKDQSETIASSVSLFQRYREIGLASQGNLANDDSKIVLVGKSDEPGLHHIILFSFKENKVVTEFPLRVPRLDYATLSPKGTWIVANGEFEKGKPDRTRVFDRRGRAIGSDWGPYGTPSHYDLTIDEAGREIVVGVAKTALKNIAAGSIIARDLATGEIRLLLAGGYAMHISCRNFKLPGWAFVSYGTVARTDYPPFSNELVAVRTDGSGQFRRLCQFHVAGDDYWAQPQACPNSKGTLAVFATHWNDPRTGAESAVVETGL